MAFARKVGAGDGIGIFDNLFRCTGSNHFASQLTGTGAHIYHVVRRANGVFVVLYHQYRIAAVTKLFQGFYQAVIVALMKSDGRLVQDVQHTHETRTDLGCQANTLGFTAGKCGCRTRKRQIIEANVYKKLQPRHNFFHNGTCNEMLAFRQLQSFEELQAFPTGHLRNFPDVLLANRDR